METIPIRVVLPIVPCCNKSNRSNNRSDKNSYKNRTTIGHSDLFLAQVFQAKSIDFKGFHKINF